MKFTIALLTALLLASIAHGHESAAPTPKGTGLKVLVYSNTGYYRHPETPKINRWLVLLGHENGFEVDVTEHWKNMRAGTQRLRRARAQQRQRTRQGAA